MKRILAGLLLALSALAPFGADAASLYIEKWQQLETSSGTPCAGCKLYFYTTGTTTAKDTFSDEALATANANPITLNSAGRVPSQVWISGRYRVVFKTAAGVTISDDDPVEDVTPGSDIQDGAATYCGSNSGTANALVFTCSPAPSSYTAGMALRGRITADNSSSVTANFNAVGAKSVVKNDGEALVSGDLQGPGIITVVYDATTDVFRLQSPDAAALLKSTTTSRQAAVLSSATLGEGALLTGTHTIPYLAASMYSRTTNGAAAGLTELATNDVMLASKDFDQTTSEGVQFYLPANKAWNESTITANFGWTAAAGAGTVTFAIGCTAFGNDDAMDTAFGAAQSVTDTLITANDLHITDTTAAITIGGTPAENDFVICQITRDVADTLNADAKLIWARIFWTQSAGNDN